MGDATWVFLGVLATSLATFVVTAYKSRRNGPEHQVAIITVSDKLLTQLQTRIQRLEERVAALESENDRYHRLYGPLPVEPKTIKNQGVPEP